MPQWRTRQLDAVVGLIPIFAVACGAAVGGGLAEMAGLPSVIGIIVFGIAGFFVSRFALRRYFSVPRGG